MRFLLRCAPWGLSFFMVACANLSTSRENAADAAPLADTAPLQWQAPLPRNGRLLDMRQWWQQHGDPLLVVLVDGAQTVSPSVAMARSRIEQSRSALAISHAAQGPSLDASASASRALNQPNIPVATTLQAGLLAAWEIDLFGANRSASAGAAERLASAQASWHDARVSAAAETANQYFQLLACHEQLALTRLDADSRRETVRLLDISTRAGFTASGDLALGRAGAADAANQVVVVGAQCDAMVKALVALTGLAEPGLRLKLTEADRKYREFAPVFIATIPAEALDQRPDLFAASRDIAAASHDLSSSQAQIYPRLSLSGSIGFLSANVGGFTTEMSTWSIGPLALSLPLFDGGRRKANTEAAKARYDEAVALYRARARQAVREVEQALVNLKSASDRSTHTDIAAEAWRAALNATLARQRIGFANLIEVEEVRRQALAADVGRLGLQRDRLLAWVAVYRAVGGGWQPAALLATTPGKVQ